jgi:hypothetical protein
MVMAAAAEVEEVEENRIHSSCLMKFLQIKDCHFKIVRSLQD